MPALDRPPLRALAAPFLAFWLLLDPAVTGAQARGETSMGSAYGVFSSHGLEPEFQRRNGLGDTRADFDYVDREMETLGVHWTRLNLVFQWTLIEPTIAAGYDWDAPEALTGTLIEAVYRDGGSLRRNTIKP